jgi:SAM-dependent methyltransferase
MRALCGLLGCLFVAVCATALSAAPNDTDLAAGPKTVQPKGGAGQGGQLKPLDVIYVPTPPEVVAQMLTVAAVSPGDVVYDLGSGDGRIVIAAVRDYGAARGVGIELDPIRNREADANARAAGVSDRVRFEANDLFEADLSAATVVTLYLLPDINRRLAPKLRALKPGTRIVSHNYDLGPTWKPEKRIVLDRDVVYFWKVPKR